MGLLLLGSEKRLRVRARQALLTWTLNIALIGIAHFGVVTGLMDATAALRWEMFALIGATSFYVMVRSGFSLRFASDPAMTLPQAVFSVVSTMGAYVVAGPARGASLLVMAVTLVFGLFALTAPQVRRLSFFAVVAMGATMLAAHLRDPARFPAAEEGMNFMLLAVVLPSIALLAGQLSTMRLKLRQQRDELERALERNHEIAIRDELTGIYNRRHLTELMNGEMQRFERSGRPVCLALIDIDHFKRVNDVHGHAQGDEVLRAFALTAREALRESDTLGRWGGEEFMLMLPDTSAVGTERVIERVRQRLADVRFEQIDPAMRVTFSAGIAQCQVGETLSALIERADQAMYAAKQGGRDRSVISEAPVAVPRLRLVASQREGVPS